MQLAINSLNFLRLTTLCSRVIGKCITQDRCKVVKLLCITMHIKSDVAILIMDTMVQIFRHGSISLTITHLSKMQRTIRDGRCAIVFILIKHFTFWRWVCWTMIGDRDWISINHRKVLVANTVRWAWFSFQFELSSYWTNFMAMLYTTILEPDLQFKNKHWITPIRCLVYVHD